MSESKVSESNYPEIIAQLQQRIETQEYQIQKQSQQVQHLEDRIVALQFKLEKLSQPEEQLTNLKRELMRMIADQGGRTVQRDGQGDELLTTQLEHQAQTINKLQRELHKTQRFEEQITMARTDFERLNKTLHDFETRFHDLEKQFDRRIQTASYLEQQRRAEAQRMAELQAELPNLRKQITNELITKIETVERQIPQFAQYQLELEKIREETRQHREHMEYQIAQRERQMNQWTQLSNAHEQRMSKYEGAIEKYAEHYQANKRILESLQDFKEGLQREQHQAAELQRLAEERLRTSFEKWKTDYEQRWKQQSTNWKPNLSDFERNTAMVQKDVEKLRAVIHGMGEQIDLVLQIIEEDIQHRTMKAQDWQQRFEEIATQG